MTTLSPQKTALITVASSGIGAVYADLIAMGRPSLANPDLVARMRQVHRLPTAGGMTS